MMSEKNFDDKEIFSFIKRINSIESVSVMNQIENRKQTVKNDSIIPDTEIPDETQSFRITRDLLDAFEDSDEEDDEIDETKKPRRPNDKKKKKSFTKK